MRAFEVDTLHLLFEDVILTEVADRAELDNL